MSYVARDDRPADKADRYAEVEAEVLAVLEGEPNLTARMATVASMLADAFDDFFWTGFYVVAPDKADELVVGPYQGTLGCLRIAFGRGVCGAAAATRRTQLVEDVQPFGQRDRGSGAGRGGRTDRRVRRGCDDAGRLRRRGPGGVGAADGQGLRRRLS